MSENLPQVVAEPGVAKELVADKTVNNIDLTSDEDSETLTTHQPKQLEEDGVLEPLPLDNEGDETTPEPGTPATPRTMARIANVTQAKFTDTDSEEEDDNDEEENMDSVNNNEEDDEDGEESFNNKTQAAMPAPTPVGGEDEEELGHDASDNDSVPPQEPIPAPQQVVRGSQSEPIQTEQVIVKVRALYTKGHIRDLLPCMLSYYMITDMLTTRLVLQVAPPEPAAPFQDIPLGNSGEEPHIPSSSLTINHHGLLLLLSSCLNSLITDEVEPEPVSQQVPQPQSCCIIL